MLSQLIDRFRGSEPRAASPPPPEEQDPVPCSSGALAEQLDEARASFAVMGQRLYDARCELAEAQGAFDAGVSAYALGTASAAPDRGALAASIATTDGLGRIHAEQQRKVNLLAEEIASTQLREAIAAGAAKLPELSAAAEDLLSRFEDVIVAAKRVENELFALLYEGPDSLRQCFVTHELEAEAVRLRFSLSSRAQDIALQHGYVIDGRFETDGNVNLSRECIGLYARTPSEVNHALITRLYRG